MRLLTVAVGLAACCSLAFAPTGAGRRGDAPATLEGSFRSAALDSRLHYLIHLPAGYETSGLRYPVLYFLHGLPAGPESYRGVAWVADALDDTGRQAILVVPQGTRRKNGDPEYHDWGPGHNWATALGSELPAWIDAHYRTIDGREGRGIVGLSAGGYGAASLGLSRPRTYASVESWSGYFQPTDPTGTTALHLGAAASMHAQVTKLRTQFARWPTFLAFYVGRADPTFVPENRTFHAELAAAHVPHTFVTYAGGHSDALWRAHAEGWLAMALARLAPAHG
jgi:enterochelin esterase-like enzyme